MQPSQEDIELFRLSVGPLKELKPEAPPEHLRPEPIPEQTQLQTRQLRREMLAGDLDPSELEMGEELLYVRSGVRYELLRRLRCGHFSIQGQLDLHGMTVPLAREALSGFLRSCRAAGQRCVLVIHGKGKGSVQKQPVLKGKLNRWLQQRSEVLAFCSARPVDGGTGAVYVLLKGS